MVPAARLQLAGRGIFRALGTSKAAHALAQFRTYKLARNNTKDLHIPVPSSTPCSYMIVNHLRHSKAKKRNVRFWCHFGTQKKRELCVVFGAVGLDFVRSLDTAKG